MQFILLGYDGNDEKALDRRMTVREDHLKLATKMYNEGKLLFAAGILNDDGKMIGSNMIFEFPTHGDLDDYLKIEPYVFGKVWQRIEVNQCQVAPFCLAK
jgi:uncharacterized protein YciI